MVVIACNESQSTFLFPSPNSSSTDRLSESVFSGLKAVMTDAMQAQSGGENAVSVNRGSLLAGALSQVWIAFLSYSLTSLFDSCSFLSLHCSHLGALLHERDFEKGPQNDSTSAGSE